MSSRTAVEWRSNPYHGGLIFTADVAPWALRVWAARDARPGEAWVADALAPGEDWRKRHLPDVGSAMAAVEGFLAERDELARLRAIAAGEVDQLATDGRENGNRRGDWTQMVSGRRMWALDVRPGDIFVADIAHGLALTNRFGGHTREPYNVAQHSVLVSLHCDPADARWGLLHDASEGLGLPDIVGPIKRFLPWFKPHEKRLMSAVCARYNLGEIGPPSVKVADRVMLATEKRDLMCDGGHWEEIHGVSPLAERIEPWSWQYAERAFLDRFEELFPGVRAREEANEGGE